MSYVSTQFLVYDNSTDASFRSWGGAISAAIAAMGWVPTTDPQVNWSTVTSPAGGAWIAEYWKPGDSGTSFVLKVEYGSNSATPKGPRFRMTVAAGSDGSGNLTGLTSNIFDPGSAAYAPGTGALTYDCYFSGDTDRIGMLLWRSFTNSSGSPAFFFGVERTKNSDGTNSNDGVTIIALGPNTNPAGYAGHQTVIFGVGVCYVTNLRTIIALSNFVNASGAFNNNIPASPVFPNCGKYGNPLTIAAVVHAQDVAECCQFTTTLYGATRTYLATAMVTFAPTNCKFCMRYD